MGRRSWLMGASSAMSGLDDGENERRVKQAGRARGGHLNEHSALDASPEASRAGSPEHLAEGGIPRRIAIAARSDLVVLVDHRLELLRVAFHGEHDGPL